jgi:gamma-glutamyl:cysteine ligase YbdK (ATP-grasp superfamily)
MDHSQRTLHHLLSVVKELHVAPHPFIEVRVGDHQTDLIRLVAATDIRAARVAVQGAKVIGCQVRTPDTRRFVE